MRELVGVNVLGRSMGAPVGGVDTFVAPLVPVSDRHNRHSGHEILALAPVVMSMSVGQNLWFDPPAAYVGQIPNVDRHTSVSVQSASSAIDGAVVAWVVVSCRRRMLCPFAVVVAC